MSFDSDDLAAFVDSDMPGYALGTLSGGGTAAGLFSERGSDAFGLVAAPTRSFLGKSADLTGVTVGSTVTISGTAYTVSAIEPDFTGISRLQLK